MKTTEEKAKAYDEALEKIKVLQEDWKSTHNRAWVEIEEVFPQLAESKDERIRKWLYDYISNCPNNNFSFYGGVGKNAVLNYLEKQKEPLGGTFSSYEMAKTFTGGQNYVMKHPEKFGLQKPAEWSEEDENKIESIKGLITTGRFADTNTIRTIWKLLDSIRPRPSWKPSEEQMDALMDAINDSIMRYDYHGSPLKEEVTRTYSENLQSLYTQLKKL